MIGIGTLGKLRRRHLASAVPMVKGERISAMVRNTHLSRNTVRKYVAAQTCEPRLMPVSSSHSPSWVPAWPARNGTFR